MEIHNLKEDIINKLTPQEVYGDIQNQKEGTNGWVSGLCPMHDDHDNSFAFCTDPSSKDYLRWKCFSHCGGGSAIDYIMLKSGDDFKTTLHKLADKYGLIKKQKETLQPIKKELVEQYHQNLLNNEKIKQWFVDKRGLHISTLKKYKIGWDDKQERNTIPIFDKDGNVMNIRLYNAKKTKKMLNYTIDIDGKETGYGSPIRLYGLDEMISHPEIKQVIICEGEWDRLLLMQNEFLAVTGTGGCGTFLKSWIKEFDGKDVIIIYDCDTEGKKAVLDNVLPAFKDSKVNSIKWVILPLSGEKDKKGKGEYSDKDITDYLHKKSLTPESLQELIDRTPIHDYSTPSKPEEKTFELDSFVRIEEKQFIDKKVQCELVVCGETSDTYHAVEEFKVTHCPVINKGTCSLCQLNKSIPIPIGSQEYIGSCMSTNSQVVGMLRDYCCKKGAKPIIEVNKKTVIKEFYCHQVVKRMIIQKQENGKDDTLKYTENSDGKSQELLEKRVYYISSEKVSPGNYKAIGWVKTHPKTQEVTLLIETLIPIEDDFQSFRLEDNIENLKTLKSMTIKDKIDDLRENVIQVFQRDEMITAVLLTYCCPLHILFTVASKKQLIRGWISTIIVGDSGVAKTQTVKFFGDYIGIGDMFSGQTGSRTGLTYAMEETKNKGWIVKVGRFPANTRKILVIDEVQEIPIEELKTIAKAMDEGWIQIDRVSSKGYETMTRLLMLGNPQGESIMDEYQFGCLTLKGVLPTIVIRRVDLALFANANDILNANDIMRGSKETVKHVITSQMMKSLIFWAWTLKPEDIQINDEVEDKCYKMSFDLADKYGYATDVPLITRYESAKTLIRIATSIAILDVSTDKEFQKLIVKENHIEWAYAFLDRIYSSDNCMLNEYSELKRKQDELSDYDDINNLFMSTVEKEKHSPFGKNMFLRLMEILWNSGIAGSNNAKRTAIKRNDFADMVGCDKNYIGKKVKILKRYSLIETTRDGYIKLPKFIRFFKRFRQEHPDIIDQMSIDEILEEKETGKFKKEE